MVVAADGGSSTIKRLLNSNVTRDFAGYVAWRGTVPELQLSESAKESFVEKFTFFHSTGIQILGYLIPGREGTLERGERLFNWVWYCNYKDGSPELEELMTDIHGKTLLGIPSTGRGLERSFSSPTPSSVLRFGTGRRK
jgi:2-polyprenyl-6-methoxyphenol hydroxylase-like FAD-dependent oxidoreductase